MTAVFVLDGDLCTLSLFNACWKFKGRSREKNS